MYKLLKPLLFALPPERAHKLVTGLLHPAIASLWNRSLKQMEGLERELFGIRFPNPVGLAAGFDKEGAHIAGLAALGFGFIELGTVTPRPQAGNPRPRLFRLVEDRALINRMGFNNAGVEAFAERLKKFRAKDQSGLIIGGNIGKNKTTPNEKALDDYAICFEKLFPLVDYFVVNVSSPNTPGLRDLQEKEPLTRLLRGLQTLNARHKKPKPLLLKIAPDLSFQQLAEVLQIAFDTRLSGLIATNTTISREGLRSPQQKIQQIGAGGLSGAPLRKRSTEIIRFLHKESGGKLPVIGVGGIQSPEDALEKMEAGASLVQIFTGLIYRGPGLIGEIARQVGANS
ncbi:MAG TPA: quinone-dependent dihydroorotate dehydrogenase [Phaeodactylibacter sp.]|nr:quinone-dependent dihydroorotate dehydrogenase [Phaeodactylibacter sp.]